MKKSWILLLGLLFVGTSIRAQNFYVRGGLGCAVSTSANIIMDYTYQPGTGNIENTVAKKGGYGTGLPIVVAGGYTLNKYLGLEFGIDYFFGFSYKSVSDLQSFTTEYKRHGQMLSLVPAVVIMFPQTGKIQPYARLGLKLGILNTVTTNYSRPQSGSTQSLVWESKDYGGVAVGVQAAVGAEYTMNKRMSFFGEVQLDGISYAPKHGKYTEYTLDGTDKLPIMTVQQKQWNYMKELDPSKTIPDTQTDEKPMVNHKFGNAALVVGVKIKFI